MESINEENATGERVSAVTKHIKLYSNNPTHQAISEIIDLCSKMDESVVPSHSEYCKLQAASNKLTQLVRSNKNNVYPVDYFL